MFKNYLKIALRFILKNKTLSLINVAGPAVGLSCCLIVGLFVSNELAYDRFHSKHERIFRLASDLKSNNSVSTLAATPAPWGPLLEKDYPQIESAVRILRDDRSIVGKPDEQKGYEQVLFSDPTILKVFDFPLRRGKADSALVGPNKAVLTVTTALKYFGDTDPIGKTLKVTTAFGSELDVEVTGITDDVPLQAHFHFQILMSMQTLGDISGFWSYHMFYTYLLLRGPGDRQPLENLLPAFAEKYVNHNPQADGKVRLFLQSLTDIHLHSQLAGEIEPTGNITYVYILSGIAAFILLLACFNFINLSTVHSLQRGREVGLRKTAGAKRRQLIFQFLGETTILMLMAAVVAVLITQAALPFFNSISQKDLSILPLAQPEPAAIVVGFLLTVAFLAGLYPAFVLSAFRPAEVLKGNFQKSLRGNAMRRALVTLQFAISIILVACTIMLYQQLGFLRNKDLGFDRSHVMILTIPRGSYGEKITDFENTLSTQAAVVSAAGCSSVPTDQLPRNLVRPEGSADENRSMQMLFVDDNFIKTSGMEIVAGRDFYAQSTADQQGSFILNEEAVKELGWGSPEDALSRKFDWVLPDRVLKSGSVIGVIKDINFRPLTFRVEPLVIHIQPNRLQYVYVRLQPRSVDENIKKVEAQFKAAFPTEPFEFTFLDQTIQHLYENEQRLGKIFGYASTLTIIIASMGIFALSMYSVKQRTKEVGIRKVLGARAVDILKLSTKEFVAMALLANLFAWPVGWFAISKGLEIYAYRVVVNWMVFPVSGLMVFLVAMVTVSFDAFKALTANPVDSLRNE